MGKLEPSARFESRIPEALVWLLRIALLFLLVSASLGGDFQQALALAAILGIHGAVYWGAPRIKAVELKRWPARRESPAGAPWGLTIADIVLGALAFYLTRNVTGQAGILGYCLAGIVAARLGLWLCLAANAAIWLAFMLPLIYPWLWLGEPFPLALIGSFLIYLALTFIVNYLVSMEARQARIAQDAFLRLRRLSTVQEVTRTIGATLEMEAVLQLVMTKAVEILDAEAGSLLLAEGDDAGEGTGKLIFRVVLGPAAEALLGQRLPPGAGIAGRVVRTGQPALVSDVSADPDYVTVLPTTRSEIAVPINREGRVIGVLSLESGRVSAFTEDDLRFMEHLAEHAAIAIENARQLQEERQRVQTLSAIAEIGQEIRASLDLGRTLDLTLTRVRDLVDYYLAEICLWDEAQHVLMTHASAGDARYTPRTGGIYHLDEGFTGWIARHQQQLLIADITTRQDVRPKIVAEDTPVRSYVGLPLRTGETFVGTLELASDRTGAYTEDHLEILQLIADQAAVAIQSARLFEAQQKRLRELGILFETSAAVSSSLELNEVLSAVALHMARALGVSSCSISDWDPTHDAVTTLAAEAVDPARKGTQLTGDIGERYLLADYPATAEVLHSRQPRALHVSDPDCDPAERGLLQAMGQQSLLLMPLVARDRVVGLVELYEYRHRHEFSPEDIRLCQALANQAAIAIENARLYERTDERLQARVDQLMALQRITQELNATLERDHILQVVLESAIQTTSATHGNVILRDPATGRFSLRAAGGYSAEEQAAIEEMLRHLASESLTSQVVESGKALMVDDTRLEPYGVAIRPDTRSAMAVPIFVTRPVVEIAGVQVRYKGEIVGIIHLRHTEVGAFDQEDLAFVQALAEQAAIAIGNSMRYEEQTEANNALRRRTEQMTGLLTVGQKLRADVALEDTLEEIAYAIQETVGFNYVIVNVAKGRPPLLHRLAAAGMPLDLFEQMKAVTQPLERYERIFREEYRQGLCYFYPFQRRDDWEAELDTYVPMAEIEGWQEGQWHPNDMLLAPLRGSGGRLLGYISVDEPRDGQRPSRQTLEVLSIFASQATIAVENANLYAEAQRRAESLALINGVGRTLTQVTEPTQVLGTVVQAITELLPCEMSAVFQASPIDGRFRTSASRGISRGDMDRLFGLDADENWVHQVATARAHLLIPDTEQQPGLMGRPFPVNSMLIAPMMAGNRVLSVVAACSTQKHAFTQADQILLTTLVDQAAVALESARLFADTQQAAVQLSLLNEIGRRAAARLELREMLETTVEALHQNLGYYRVAVLLEDEAKQELSCAAANRDFWPFIPAGYRQKVGEGLIGAAAAAGKTVLANDAFSDERFLPMRNWAAPASVSVPIKVGGQVAGVLHAEAEQTWAFTEEDAAALEIAADQLAVAIENARLFEQIQRRAAELATVNEIGRAISSALDTGQLADLIFMHVSRLLDTRNFHVALYDAAAELIRIEFLVQEGQRQPPTALRLGEGLTSYLVSTGKPILLRHGTDEFHQEHGLRPAGPPAKSWLGVPMIAEDRVIGGIVIQSYDREEAFDKDHLNLLNTIAGQAAVAYQNALLFKERDQRIAALAVLNETAQAFGSTLQLDALLELIYRQLSRLMDTTNFYIALYDEEKDEIGFPFVVDPEQREDWSPRKGDEGLTGRIIKSGEPLLLPVGVVGMYREAGREIDTGRAACRSWLGVPMIAADRVLGVIAVQSYEREHVFDQGHLNLLSTVAGQAAVAVRNAQLYRQIVSFSSELEERVEARTRDLAHALRDLTAERDRAETLYRITSELGASLDLERVLQHALQLFADALGVEHGTITLLDQETGYLRLKAALGVDQERAKQVEPTPLRRGVGLAGWTLEHRRPVLVPDVTQDPRWVTIDGWDTAIRSVVAAPLSLGGGDILGVLTLGHSEIGHFTEEHLQLVTAAASQIAIAVNNSDLYAYITEQADQLGTMLQAQQAEAAKSRAILESIADGVLVLDHNGRVLLLNPAAEELLGFSAMALEGEHFRHMLGLGETSAQRELAQSLYHELRGRLESREDQAGLQAGVVRVESGNQVLAVNITPLVIAVGGAPGLVAALRDISREAEVERLKNEFISTVSHELRTPMTSIKGYTDLLFLGMAGGLTDAQRSFLQIIKSNADRLTALVNDILDISRIETGRLRLVIEPLELGRIISDVVLAFQEQYREKDLFLEWAEPPDLPLVRGDAARVTQVLNNLIANAWQYTPGGGRVSVSVRTADGFVQVDVSDTGIGISADDIGRVFDRFYRVDHPVVEEAGGTGLGLAIVKMFVEILGGEIWVNSELGVGSTFSFTLPLVAHEAPEVVPDLFTTEAPTVIGRRQKLLVIEDDHDLALLLRRQLESEGYQVLLAGSGEDALWLAREEKPQLITLDIVLPDLDGFVVLERLKEHPATAPIPVIIVSAVLGDPEGGYALGAVDYVVKPFDEDKLLSSIREALKPAVGSKPHRLLVVDDDPDILSFLDHALSFHGYDVSTAPDGKVALERVEQEHPDLILLDLRMPGLDGYEVIRRLKSNDDTRPIPIVVITASPIDKDRDKVRVLSMGAEHYVTKPLSIQALVGEIKKAIAERQAE
jgi:PAS domain S-box-containing protein